MRCLHRGFDRRAHASYALQRGCLCRRRRQVAPLYAVVRWWRDRVIQPLWDVDVAWSWIPGRVRHGRAEVTTLDPRGLVRIEVDASLTQVDAERALNAALASLSILELQLQCAQISAEIETLDLRACGELKH
jgi:hypothetical protein